MPRWAVAQAPPTPSEAGSLALPTSAPHTWAVGAPLCSARLQPLLPDPEAQPGPRGCQATPHGQPGPPHTATHSRPRACGSASRCRRPPGRRGPRRSAGWRTPCPSWARSSCQTRRRRSSAGGVPGRGTGQTHYQGEAQVTRRAVTLPVLLTRHLQLGCWRGVPGRPQGWGRGVPGTEAPHLPTPHASSAGGGPPAST